MDNTSGIGSVGSGAGGAGIATSSGGNVTKTNVAYLRTLSAPTPSPSHNIYQQLHHHYANKAATCGSSTSTGTCIAAIKPQRNSLAGVSLFNATFEQQPPPTQLNLNLSQTTNFQQQSNEAALNALTAACCSKPTNDTKSTAATATVTATAKSSPTTVLKIEETSSTIPQMAGILSELETLQQKRLRQLNIEMDNIRNTSIDQSQQLSALMQQNHYCTAGNSSSNNNNNNSGTTISNKHKNLMTSTPVMIAASVPKKVSLTGFSSLPSNASNVTCNASGKVATTTTTSSPLQQQNGASAINATSYLLHGSDATKKGSTSTIWTSEESILRSVGAVDEDNK